SGRFQIELLHSILPLLTKDWFWLACAIEPRKHSGVDTLSPPRRRCRASASLADDYGKSRALAGEASALKYFSTLSISLQAECSRSLRRSRRDSRHLGTSR